MEKMMDARTLYKIGRKMKDGLGLANAGGPLNEYILNKALHEFADATMAVAKEMEQATMKKVVQEERWVAVEGFPNYEVSSYGRVFNVKFQRYLMINAHKDTYCYVKLSREGVQSTFLVHRLVARAFFVNYRNGYEIAHLNKNHEDNTVANLHLSPKRNRMRDI